MASTPQFNTWFPYRRASRNARVRLFCFPYAGGGASIYRLWPQRLPEQIEVWPLQLPGRENRLAERPVDDFGEIVQVVCDALQPYLDMPYAFFGHSMGASISFEVVRRLRRYQSPGPLHLFVSGRHAPQVKSRGPQMYALPEQEFIEGLRRLEGTPEEVLQNSELLHLLLPVIRADFKLSETYTYRPEDILTCPISVYGGLADHEATREDLEAWRKETSGPFTLRMFPGGHFFLHSAQAEMLQVVARELLSTS